MEVNINPLYTLEAGKKQLARLMEENFQGYLPTCIEDLLKATDLKFYSFEDLGITEVEALELMIDHVGKERSTLSYKFPYDYLLGQLECRKLKAFGAHRLPAYAEAFAPKVVDLGEERIARAA